MDRKNNIISKLAKEKAVETMCINMGDEQSYFDDLVQEIYLIILEYDDNKIIKNQYFSKNSPFYKKYKMYDQRQDNNKEIESEGDEFDTED